MLFSCLVDADFLDTEQFMNSGRHFLREKHPSLLELKRRFDSYMVEKANSARHSEVNRSRHYFANAEKKHALAPGLFSLTVPTGGEDTF